MMHPESDSRARGWRFWSRIRLIAVHTAVSAVIGIAYGYWLAVRGQGDPVQGSAIGAIAGALIAFMISSLELLLMQTPGGERIRRMPFLVHTTIKAVLYLLIISVSLRAAVHIVALVGDPPIPLTFGRDTLISLIIAFVVAFLLNVNRLLGQNVLLSFVTGRYYRPRVESRIFLFIDMAGSTRFGEKLGPLKFFELLSRFVSDLAEPIAANRGEIYRYVGDELIATWTLAEGVKDARCIRAYFDAVDRFARLSSDYQRAFGEPVAFRAALHCGPVVAGEMGSLRKEIAFLGDTVNTAARIEDACRQSGHGLLASADLIEQLALPPEFRKISVGRFQMRGKTADLELFAIERANETTAT